MLYRLVGILLIVIINPCTELHAQERDTIRLYNGQVLIGEIRSGTLGEITIDDRDLRNVELKAYKIKRLNAVQRFKIEMNTKEIYYGTVKAADKEGWVNIISDNGDTVLSEITSINTITPVDQKFLKQLKGNLSAGFTYAKSSDVGQINLSSSVLYETRLFQYQLSASAIASIDSSRLSRDQENATFFVAYYFRPAWFLASAVSYQRNLELSIAARYQGMIGAGNKIFIRRYWHLLALSGMTFNRETSTSGTISGLLLEVPITFLFNFFKYRKPNLQISSGQNVYFSLSQKGRIRYSNDTKFSWELVKDFWLTLNPYANFDNQPPEGNSNFDYGVALSLTFKF